MAAELMALLDRLRHENDALRAELATLQQANLHLHQQLHDLQEQLDEARRGGARQAAPFRRPDRAKLPADQKKRPGREPGHPGAYRAVPARVDEQAEAPLSGCPHCGAALTRVTPVEQFLEDLPPRRPHVTRLVTYTGTCPAAARSGAATRCRCPTPPAPPRSSSARGRWPWPRP